MVSFFFFPRAGECDNMTLKSLYSRLHFCTLRSECIAGTVSALIALTYAIIRLHWFLISYSLPNIYTKVFCKYLLVP